MSKKPTAVEQAHDAMHEGLAQWLAGAKVILRYGNGTDVDLIEEEHFEEVREFMGWLDKRVQQRRRQEIDRSLADALTMDVADGGNRVGQYNDDLLRDPERYETSDDWPESDDWPPLR